MSLPPPSLRLWALQLPDGYHATGLLKDAQDLPEAHLLPEPHAPAEAEGRANCWACRLCPPGPVGKCGAAAQLDQGGLLPYPLWAWRFANIRSEVEGVREMPALTADGCPVRVGWWPGEDWVEVYAHGVEGGIRPEDER